MTPEQIAELRELLPPIARGDSVQMHRESYERAKELTLKLLDEREALITNLECSHDAERILGERLKAARNALIAALAWESETRGRLGLPQLDAPEWVVLARNALPKSGR